MPADPPTADRPTYRVLLRPEPGTPWELVRLRKILKILLRAHGFRCREAVELPQDARNTVGRPEVSPGVPGPPCAILGGLAPGLVPEAEGSKAGPCKPIRETM
jgi:hypothetical protein